MSERELREMQWSVENKKEGKRQRRRKRKRVAGVQIKNGVVLLAQNDVVLYTWNLASADADNRSSESMANDMSFLT